MCSDFVIQVHNLTKTFKLYQRCRDRLMELAGAGERHRDFTALKEIDFSLRKGETLGIIGENGSGKSTLLKLIAGILMQDHGEIKRQGRIPGLLDLGTGFNHLLSGRNNIYLNGMYLDLKKDELAKREQAIIKFSELGHFIDEPLKSYSSGMLMRLGFSIAIHADPQCFIIDEALSVGDVRFQQKCFDRLNQFRATGGSILFVSHDLNAVKRLSSRVLLLNKGVIQFIGDPEIAVNQYNELLAAKGNSGTSTRNGYGNGDITFTSIHLEDRDGNPAKAFMVGQSMRIIFKWKCCKPTPNVTFGALIRDRFGQDIFGTNGNLLNVVKDIDSDGEGVFTIKALDISPGVYSINMAAHTGDTHLDNCFHWLDNAADFEVLENPDDRFWGLAKLKATLSLK